MNPEYEIRCQHFADLKEKYQAAKYEDSSPSSPLYFVLRKADLGIELTDLESIYLQKEKLSTTFNIIQKEQQHRKKIRVTLDVEFTKLKSKYQVNNSNISWITSDLYFILCKIDSGDFLTEKEFNWLLSHGLKATTSIAIETQKVTSLKSKYKATQYQDCHPDSPLYPILKKIDSSERLTETEYKWLIEKGLSETLEFVKQQEAKERNEFVQLKEKYQATKYKIEYLSSPLYSILKKLESKEKLFDTEITWLKEQELTETIAIVEEREEIKKFAALKFKYKATEYEDISPKSHLYKVLRIIHAGNFLGEQDINFLKKRKLNETLKIASNKYANYLKTKIEINELLTDSEIEWLQNQGREDVIFNHLKSKIEKDKLLTDSEIEWLKNNGRKDVVINHLKSKIKKDKLLTDSEIEWLKNNGREDVILLVQERLFSVLKSKYAVSDYKDKSPNSPLYAILRKLEISERIEPKDFGWLQENWLLSHKILIEYHIIEADFYQQEFKRTGNKWNLVNASSHLRKADKPKSALQLTNNLPLNNIKDNKLKSALLTTRGGAFRDIDKLGDAETCAREAMKYQSDSHHPYTLMGAICFERHQYTNGEYWFNEAIKRGAKPLDMDSEIKSVLKKTKDEKQRQELVNYLLKKDSYRYAWAKDYLKKQQDKK